MRLYLDDDSAHPLLIRLLRQAGHDVILPADVGMVGKADPVHFIFAAREDRVLISRNYRDFQDLHDLIMQTKGHHPGIFIVRRDNGGKRNLSPRDIVRAIGNLLAAAIPVADQYIILNQWQ